MEFGKLHNISHVNFTLPPDSPENEHLWKQISANGNKNAFHLFRKHGVGKS